MVRMIKKSKQSLCITEEGTKKSSHIFEFHYQDTTGVQTAWNPNMDIFETEDALVVMLEAAGLDESSLKLHAVENRLVLSGDRRMELGEQVIRYHQLEIQFMPFQKTIILPNAINIEHVVAEYKNGFLLIRVSKKDLKG